MRGVNKALIIGNLGADPEVRYLPSGAAVANLSVATSEQWKDRETGETQKKTEWHRCTLWGKLAEVAAQYLHKGDSVYLEGKLETRKWTDRNNVERYTTEIRVFQMEMLGSKSGGSETSPEPASSAPPSGGDGGPTQGSGPGDFEDDIPF